MLLHELVVAQAARTPDAVAVRQWARRLGYGELVSRAAALARDLQRHGAGPEVKVGVCGRRTPALLVAVLGVLLSGAAYVPLDPGHPRRRLATMLDDAAIGMAVVDAAGRALLRGSRTRRFDLARDRGPAHPPPCAALPESPAYVMYTSGSTGRPKGVVVSHRSVVAFVTAAGELFGLDGSCRSIGFAALGFDVSILDIFVPLSRGGSVQLVPDEDRVDPARLGRFLAEHAVTWGALPAALLPLLDPERLPGLADLVAAGEPPGPEQVVRWSAPGRRRFHNWYGPTETTVCVTGTELAGAWDRPLPIGRHLPGCQVHVLDEQMGACPPGVPGEIHVGGPQLARGYLGRPDLTAERFVPDPLGGQPGARLYRTGDLAAVEPDGRIGFLGRRDRQVKIRGQRVEIGEVESVLRAHPGVRQAVVDVASGAGGTELVAYVAPLAAPDLDELRRHCAVLLPTFMLPVRAVHVETMPLTAAGKIDAGALRLERAGAATAGRAPRTDVERAVAAAWARVFRTPEPGLAEDFLAAGGHSLLAMRLVSALRADLGLDVTVEDVFAGATVEGLARRVRAARRIEGGAVATGHPPALSPLQRQLWLVEQLAPATPAHNIAMAVRLRGPIEPPALRAALRMVAERHDVLRWRVVQAGGMPSVVVDPPADVPLPVEDAAGVPGEWLDREARAQFDLARRPPWRARLLRLDAGDHVLALTFHHLVFDGWSQDVLCRDLGRCYRAALAGAPAALDSPPASFADYVAWLGDRDAADGGARLAWWVDHLAGAPAVLDLPRDRARPPVQTFGGAARRVGVDRDDAAAVRALAQRLGATTYAVLLAAFGLLVSRLTGQRDLVVGTPRADRPAAEFEGLVGCFVQVLPLRLRVAGEQDFACHVRSCRDELAGAVAHAGVPVPRLLEPLGVRRELSRNPLVQVMFNMYDFTGPRLDLPEIAAEPVPPGLPGSLFDLTLYAGEDDGRFVLQAVYNVDLYSAERIEALLASYRCLLHDVVAHPERPVSEASMRPAGSGLPVWTVPLPRRAVTGVVERVRRAAEAAPDAVAASGAGGALTYRGVETVRRRTAATVRLAGLRPGDAVALLGRRDVALPAVMLGVLSSGARWAILDPALPPLVLQRQAAAAAARALIAWPGAVVPAALAHLPVIAPPGGDGRAAGAELDVPPEGRGYLSFTSGTTGEPKLVVTPEGPLAHFLDWYPRTFGLRPRDRFALLAGLAHDPLLRDAFVPLAIGARLCVPEPDRLADPTWLAAWLGEEEVTVAHLTPQLGRLLAGTGECLPALRLVGLAGDQLTEADVSRLARIAPGARVLNLYGTSETPQAQAYHEVRPVGAAPPDAAGMPVPVGRGADGAQLLVLAEHDLPAAVGELGEVVIRSRHLAVGYLDASLTRRRFLRTPGGDDEDRMYRTGDLGRFQPDGEVVLAGRRDRQVKVRGFRVELGEVEAALVACADVGAAAAVAAEDGGQVGIRAYAVPARPGVRVAELREHLRAVLPDHAVPADLVLLPELPLTPSGKVDRAALPRPALRPSAGGPDELSGRTERLVAGVWREVLGVPRVGASDNFFDIGGHSMAIVAVHARLRELLGRDVPVVDLFSHPTVRALAGLLDGDGSSAGLDWAARRVAARLRSQAGRR